KGFLFETLVASEEVGRLRVGQEVRIKLDAYNFQKYGTLQGKVLSISPDSMVADGPDGRRRISYLVRVMLEGDEVGQGDRRGRVKLGMSGLAEVVTGDESLLAILVKKINQSISLG